MKADIEEIAKIARGASEREIETEVVHIFKKAGWPRAQINQDIPISDKGADKADIVLRIDNQPVVLVEVKKHGHSRDADAQVNRYCRLLRPSPKLALLTDGVRWVLYSVGQAGALPVLEASVPNETDAIVSVINALTPEALSASLNTEIFQYLEIVEQGLQERSEDAQKHLRPFFVATARALLIPGGSDGGKLSAVAATAVTEPRPIQPPEPIKPAPAEKRSAPQNSAGVNVYDPTRPPSLAFTSSIKADFDGNTASNWNDLLRAAVRTALTTGLTRQDIQRMTNINIQEGKVTERGYAPLAGTDLSMQGMAADEAWQNTLRLAAKLGCPVKASFCWQDKEKAAHPGENGTLAWSP